jgi:hypothetical protein
VHCFKLWLGQTQDSCCCNFALLCLLLQPCFSRHAVLPYILPKLDPPLACHKAALLL